jgi:hypothetical protein
MGDISQTLLDYIQSQGFANNIHPQSLSAYPKIFLKKILEQISTAHSEWNPENISIKFSTILKDNKKFPKGSDYSYSSIEIRNEIENMDKICCTVSFNIGERVFNIAIVAPKKKEFNKEYLTSCIKRIYTWLSVSSKHARDKCSQTMNIYLYFTDLKKKLPTGPHEHLDEIHVNTAFTTSCKTTTELHLLRHEEWFKVLIHETFHNMGLDFSEFNQDDTKEAILDIFPVNSDVRLFETYCELWAEVINVLFIAFYLEKKKQDVENLDQVIKRAETMIHKEQMFSLFQCAKVLFYFGLDYEHLYEKGDKCNFIRDNKYKEKTQVLSYYILKSILFFFLDDFITWCIKHNREETLDFNKDSALLESTLDSYCRLIKDRYDSYDYIKCLRYLKQKFSSMTSEELQSTMLRTLRMTVYEIL